MDNDNKVERIEANIEPADNNIADNNTIVSANTPNDNKQSIEQTAGEGQAAIKYTNPMSTMYLNRLTKILSNMTIAYVVALILTFYAGALSLVVFVFGFFLIFATAGCILIIVPGYWSGLMSIPSKSAEILGFLKQIMPIVAPVGLGISVISLILLCCNRNDRSIARIVVGAILVAITLVLTILALGGGYNE